VLFRSATLVATVDSCGIPEIPRWEPLPGYLLLGHLASISAQRPARYFQPGLDGDSCRGACSGGADAVAANTLLRAVAGNPAEILLYEVLAREFPPAWLIAQQEALRAWFQRWADPPRGNWRFGYTMLLVRANEAEGNVEESFNLVNQLLCQDDDEGLKSERRTLVDRFRRDLLQQTQFAKRYKRDFGLPARAGGFSLVIPVFDSSTGERFALKHYILKNLPSAEMELALELSEHESGLLSKAGRHCNLIQYHQRLGRGRTVFEWIPGESLDPSRHGIGDEAGWWTVRRVLELGLGVSAAFNHVEKVLGDGFVHNDLAPRNLMVIMREGRRSDWVRVIDLGLSTTQKFYSVSAAIDDLGVRLNEAYRAPEVRAGQGSTPRSDMFSLGVILFQLLCRALPNVAARVSEFHLETVPLSSMRKPLSQLGARAASAEAFLLTLLAVSPDDRPDSWASVMKRVEELVGD